MRIVIIGGSGFIGTCLTTHLLAANHTVKIADKQDSYKYSNLRLFADVRELGTLEEVLYGSDIVINLAAEHRDDVSPKSLYDDVNVTGAENVCNACAKLGIKKIIFTSSVAVYGFAPVGTDETGEINYFNDYGRTKWFAEEKYREWLVSDPENSLTIIRPTVVFGERNRGNVYNLLRQIAEKNFLMVGNGKNIKSMAYVENIVAFIENNLDNDSGEYLYNYIDKPDFDMNVLVGEIDKMLGKSRKLIRLPYWIGYFAGLCFDVLAKILRKKLSISSIRVKKFCSNTMFKSTNIEKTNFKAPVSLTEGLRKTIQYEFVDKTKDQVFYTE